ncbi:MAG TPA: hypothetical protein VH353_08940 [Caulobacteraceae bacterium]|nr:hypothetical protein [Caulobacteraceae bacterium]
MSRGRPLTAGEEAKIHPGLREALRAAGAQPVIIAAAHPGARLATLWRGRPPVMARGDAIWWPGAQDDFSGPWAAEALATLQHELQHVLDYRIGWLTAARYLSRPRHWSYRLEVRAGLDWDALGAEQRATAAERLWVAENSPGRTSRSELRLLRELIPWAAESAR